MIITVFFKTVIGNLINPDNALTQTSSERQQWLLHNGPATFARTNVTSKNLGFFPPHINQTAYLHTVLFRGLRIIIDGDSIRSC